MALAAFHITFSSNTFKMCRRTLCWGRSGGQTLGRCRACSQRGWSFSGNMQTFSFKIKKIKRWHQTLRALLSQPQLLFPLLKSTCWRTRKWNISKKVKTTQMSHHSNRGPTCSEGQRGCSHHLISSNQSSCCGNSCQTRKASEKVVYPCGKAKACIHFPWLVFSDHHFGQNKTAALTMLPRCSSFDRASLYKSNNIPYFLVNNSWNLHWCLKIKA